MSESEQTTPALDEVRERAIDTAMTVLGRALETATRTVVAEALDAAAGVYNEAEEAEIDRMLHETGLLGIEPADGGLRIRLKHSHDIARAMVEAFDALCQARGGENYVEWESTVTDPALEKAIADGVPQDQWPPHRRYTIIVVKPDGQSPHQLRRAAEQKHDELVTLIAEAWRVLSNPDDGDGKGNVVSDDIAYMDDDWSKMARRVLRDFAVENERPMTWPWIHKRFDIFEWSHPSGATSPPQASSASADSAGHRR